MVLGIFEVERSKAYIIVPFRIAIWPKSLNTVGGAIVHQGRTDDTPSKNATSKERVCRVQPDKHAATNKSWCKFQIPTPIFDMDGEIVVFAPDVEPGEEMPIPQDAETVLGNHTEDEGASKCITKCFRLGLCHCFTPDSCMHRPDGHCCCRSGGKD